MKRVCLFFVTVLVMSLLFSCRPFRIIEIETYNPSSITLPKEIKTVMIVNNSAQQPDNVGHRYESNTRGDSTMSVSADSMAYFFCMSLGKTLVESPIFNDVRICEDTLRRDSMFYSVELFAPDEVKSFCADYGVDALISLDKLFYSTVFNENTKTYFSVANKSVYVQITGELRILWPGQEDVYAIPFVDSLSWYYDGNIYSEGAIEMVLEPDTKNAIYYLTELTGQKMQVNIIPYWSEERRWYYTNIASEWKLGSAYTAAEKWEEAAKVWESLFGKMKKWKQKARLASNLALCYEMTSDFKKAIEYAEISYGIFKENTSEDDGYLSIQQTYIDILKKRMEGEKMLSKQLGES